VSLKEVFFKPFHGTKTIVINSKIYLSTPIITATAGNLLVD